MLIAKLNAATAYKERRHKVKASSMFAIGAGGVISSRFRLCVFSGTYPRPCGVSLLNTLEGTGDRLIILPCTYIGYIY